MQFLTHSSRCHASRKLTFSRGFSFVEVMVTLPLVVLLFGGTITLFLESQRLVQRTSVTTQASQDAVVGQNYITDTARKSINFALPPDTATVNTNGMAFLAPDGNPNDYQTGGINTAVEFMLPATATLNLLDRNGNAITPSPIEYNRTTIQINGGIAVNPPPGDIVCIYRGDASSNPSANSGQYLWSVFCPAGSDYNNPAYFVKQKLCKFILTKHADNSPATDAVQFIGRNTSFVSYGADIPSSMPYELEFKLVCGDQAAIKGTQTNEAGDGNSVSALVGKCVLLRNHN